MRIILLGAPGVGKGTQANLLSGHLSIPVISTGDMLRSAMSRQTKLGLKVEGIVNSGRLVPDEIMIELVRERISQPDCRNGFLLDGFPRTIAQADALSAAKIFIDVVVEINVADDIIVERLAGRRIHSKSGRTYHVLSSPPTVHDKDDITGEPLIQRDDDKSETVKKRLAVYREQTAPLVEYYKDHEGEIMYFVVDGCQSVKLVQDTVIAYLASIKKA